MSAQTSYNPSMIPFYIDGVMRKRTAQLEKERNVARAIEKLNEEDTDLVIVTDHGKPVGVFTHTDVAKVVEEQRDVSTTRLSEMELSPVVTVEESADIETAAKIMNRNGLRYVLVTKANDIIGYLTDRDLSKAFSRADKK